MPSLTSFIPALNWAKIAAYGIAGILIFSGGAWVGYRLESGVADRLRAEAADARTEGLKIGAADQRALDQIAIDAAVREAQAQTKIQVQTITVTKEIPRYVHDQIYCPGPSIGLARILRAAADGVDPASLSGPAGQSDDACSDFTATEVAGWFAGYAGAARANTEQLTALQAWASAVQKEQSK